MLGEYKVSRCTRQCHAHQRPLREGEWYYSVVLEADDEYVRQDYSAEAWSGPPEGAIGWWKSRMPTSDEKKMILAPPEVLIDLLRQMEQFPARAKSRYLLALMLMRRKLVRPAVADNESATGDATPEDSAPDDSATGDSARDVSAHEGEILHVEVVADGSTIDVPVCKISRSESESLREELNELLYCEAEPELPDDEE